MNLDFLAAIGCGWITFCVFMLHAISHPQRSQWRTPPAYVRRGLPVLGAVWAWRSVDLFTLPVNVAVPGHVNGDGILLELAIIYMATALAVWCGIFQRLPLLGWIRLRFAEQQERRGLVPVMMTPDEVKAEALKRGFIVDAEVPPIGRGDR